MGLFEFLAAIANTSPENKKRNKRMFNYWAAKNEEHKNKQDMDDLDFDEMNDVWDEIDDI